MKLKIKIKEGDANLHTGWSEPQNPDLGPDITDDPQFDPVVQRGVPHQIGGVGLEQADPVDDDDGLDPPHAVGRLVEWGHAAAAEGNAAVHDGEPGLAVLDPHLVVVRGGEDHADVQGNGGGGGGGGADAHVLHAHLLEVELRLLRLHGEDYHQDDGEGEEGEEGEEEE